MKEAPQAVKSRYNSEEKQFGRPSSYKPEYCDALIRFFDVEPCRAGKKTFTTKNGTVIEEEVEIPENLPTFERFGCDIGVTVGTMLSWCDVYPDFHKAYTQAKAFQKNHIIQNGVKGLYNPQFTIFVAKNITDMKDVQTVEVTATADDTMLEAKLRNLLGKMSPDEVSGLLDRRMIDVTPIAALEERNG